MAMREVYWTKERLLEHLPYVYRQRDEELAAALGQSEGPLAALLDALAEQIARVEDNIGQLHDNWFVETCEPWVLAYLGGLLGIRQLPGVDGTAYTPRAYVGNIISYRRRKGTPAMLEQLARDVTGWNARVVEYFLHLDRTLHVNRVRTDEWLVPDLRDLEALERLGSPFTETHRLPDVRRASSRHQRGLFNLPSIGIHLWPLEAFAPPDATEVSEPPVAPFAIEARPEALPAAEGDPVARWFLHPLGVPAPLLNRPLSRDPASGAEVTTLATERDVPLPLRRLPLYQELEELRQAIADGEPSLPELRYLGDERPVLQLFADDELEAIPPAEICIADFSKGWPQPDATRPYTASDGSVVDLPIRAAVDPARGQVAFADGGAPARLRAIFAHGFSSAMGGGPYDRRDSVDADLPDSVEWQLAVSRLHAPEPGVVVGSLAEAIAEWNTQPAGTEGLICVLDSMRYEENLVGAAARIRIPEGSHLTILAADWPEREEEPGVFVRPLGSFSADRLRPHLLGDLDVRGSAPGASADPGGLTLDGLLVEGRVRVAAGHLGSLTLSHCTVRPASGSAVVAAAGAQGRNAELEVMLLDSIASDIVLAPSVAALRIEDAIVGRPEAPEQAAVEAPGAHLEIERSTLWGGASCKVLDASECIFDAPVVAERKQEGCVRYSYLRQGSATPRRYRCQPDHALRAAGAETDPVEAVRIRLRVQPLFESREPAEPTYARLACGAPVEIRRGGESGREMGVFNNLEAPQRQQWLESSLDEFLRAGLDAGVILETTSPPVDYGSS